MKTLSEISFETYGRQCNRLFMVFYIFCLLYCATASGTGRRKIHINSDWKFREQILTNAPAVVDYDDHEWSTVSIPHSWNSSDAQDGGGDYLRTVCWYRKILLWDGSYKDKRIYIEFLGACLQAECFVNGKSVGSHKGGYTAFRFDITSQVKPGENCIAIKVDNRQSEEIMPLAGDFSIMGGIYRDISLIVTNLVHVDLMDNGASGLYLTPSNVGKNRADLEIKASIINHSPKPKSIVIQAVVKNPTNFEQIEEINNPLFNTSTMCPGGSDVISVSKTVVIEPGAVYQFKESRIIDNPHLWNGKKDPYRYLVDLKIKEDGLIVDSISEYVGFRYFSVTKEGFFLNGNLYPLRGVCKHQDRYNKGYAIGEKEQDEDFGMIYDMGANTIRLAHYPHDGYMYDLCDRYGLVVWAEIPLIDRPGTATSFNDVTKMQLRELIRQQYNRPSIFFWGLQNEIRNHHDDHMIVLMKELNDLAHAEDPSRLTVQASNHTTARNWDSDLFAWNYYPGWYVQNPKFSDKLDDFKTSETRPTALSEYGAGGSIYHHEIEPSKPVANGGKIHPEEYQNKVHEQALLDFSTRDFVWGTFLWNMFDFASDNRNEGDQAGMNDKGLVTYDRKVKKDSYYAYKANWSDSPFVYISSRRYIERKETTTPIIIYSNCESVELFVNGLSKGKKLFNDVQCGFFKWGNISLSSRLENRVKVVAKSKDKEYVDEVLWKKTSGTSTDLYSDSLTVDTNNKRIILKGKILVRDIDKYLQSVDDASFVITESDGTTIITSGLIDVGMKAVVTSQDNNNKSIYEFVSGHIALNKSITSDSEQIDNFARYAVDGDYSTRWAATDKKTHWIEVDLGKEYVLNKITIQWYNPNGIRTYQYYIKTADDDKKYIIAVDRSENSQSNSVSDNLNSKGRYVRVEVVGGNSPTAYASLHEIEVLGWRIESREYTIDYENNLIKIPATEENKTHLTTEQFLNNILVEGNLTYSLNSMSYFIQENDKLAISDSSGKKIEFKCVFTSEGLGFNPEAYQSEVFQIASSDEGLNIELLDAMIPVQLDITDMLGQAVVSEQINNSFTCQLPAGLYLVSVLSYKRNRETVKCLIR